MAKIDKKRRSSLLNQLKKDGLNPEEEIISTNEYDEVIKSILEHMKDVGGYSSDQVREDIEAIINLKSANDTFFEVNRLQATNKRTILLVPILFTILLLLFILVLLNNAQDEFAYGLGFLPL